jgi:membrane-associated phospholipid phosphatase
LTTLFLQQKTELDPILWQGMGVMTAAVGFLTVVTFFWKMSAHMTGLGGLLAVVWVMGSYFSTFSVVYLLLLSLGLTGIVASSRLYLDAHRPVEVYGGLLAGFIICWLGFTWIYS